MKSESTEVANGSTDHKQRNNVEREWEGSMKAHRVSQTREKILNCYQEVL